MKHSYVLCVDNSNSTYSVAFTADRHELTGLLCSGVSSVYGGGMSSSPGPAPARGPLAGGRVGLSEYTAQRLAELRARRADADSADKPALAPRPSTSRTGTTTAADVDARTTAGSAHTTSNMAVNGPKSDTITTTAAASAAASYNSHSDATLAPTAPAQVSSPQHHQHNHVTASARSSSLNRRESNNAVDRTRTHQVRPLAVTALRYSLLLSALFNRRYILDPLD